jgi:hypothetical protein
VVAVRLFKFAETASPEPSLSQDTGQENLVLTPASSSSTPTTTHADPPRKAAARKNFKGAGGAGNDSSRGKVTKSEEDCDGAYKGGAVFPRFASAFVDAASVIHIETCRKVARKAPNMLSAVDLVKPRFKASRIMDSSLFRKKIKGLPYYRFRWSQ